MTLKITRVEPGHYQTTVSSRLYHLTYREDTRKWYLYCFTDAKSLGTYPTKKAAVTRLEILSRQPTDRVEKDSLKLHRRSEIKPGTKIKVEGIPGKSEFIKYTVKDDGVDWVDILTSRGFSRTVRSDRIVTVHRK